MLGPFYLRANTVKCVKGKGYMGLGAKEIRERGKGEFEK
jgi:hypothetical protein